jgi:hypothetical protein
MVSVLAIRPKVRGFIPGRGDGFLRAMKICSTFSFGEEVKPEAPCCKILQHVKLTCTYEQKYFSRPKFIIPFARSSCFLPDDSACRITRELS